MKRSLSMILALALAFTLAACGGPAETESASKGRHDLYAKSRLP